ncbi:MAG: hypothetical protein KatS3mg065_1060 [Chloroflexota bacterium]|nr:MAG: hypothetical protein KatS3mg065_1060 [Chloroflexota bacterium]
MGEEADLLDDVADPAPQRRRLPGRDVDAVEEDLAARRLDEAVHELEGRRLAAARGADEDADPAGRDPEGEVVDGPGRPGPEGGRGVVFRDVAELDGRRSVARCSLHPAGLLPAPPTRRPIRRTGPLPLPYHPGPPRPPGDHLGHVLTRCALIETRAAEATDPAPTARRSTLGCGGDRRRRRPTGPRPSPDAGHMLTTGARVRFRAVAGPGSPVRTRSGPPRHARTTTGRRPDQPPAPDSNLVTRASREDVRGRPRCRRAAPGSGIGAGCEPVTRCRPRPGAGERPVRRPPRATRAPGAASPRRRSARGSRRRRGPAARR